MSRADIRDALTAAFSDAQIRALEHEAFAAGDALMGYMCRVALGAEYTLAQLNDESCLDARERREIEALDQQSAREACERAVLNGRG